MSLTLVNKTTFSSTCLGHYLDFSKKMPSTLPAEKQCCIFVRHYEWTRTTVGHQKGGVNSRLSAQTGIWLMTWPFTSLETLGKWRTFLSCKVRMIITPPWWHCSKYWMIYYIHNTLRIMCGTYSSLGRCCLCCGNQRDQPGTAHPRLPLTNTFYYRF